MKLPLSFVELHAPLFMGEGTGKNWGVKLYKKQAKGDLLLTYDREHGEVLVKHGNAIAIIPLPNVISMWPESEAVQENPASLVQHKPVGRPPKNAQVSTPHDHVFAGNGAGKTRE